jgi:hypothetical protein
MNRWRDGMHLPFCRIVHKPISEPCGTRGLAAGHPQPCASARSIYSECEVGLIRMGVSMIIVDSVNLCLVGLSGT